MNRNYKTKQEIFNADKLSYIINNFKNTINVNNKYDKETLKTMKIQSKRYLARSRHGKINVEYKQNNCVGRYYAIHSVSLQSMKRCIRNTIAHEYYQDLDLVNAHSTILIHLCKENDIKCKYLKEYIENRDELLKALNVPRSVGKKAYISLLNGGNKDFKELKHKTDHIYNFKDEVKKIQKKLISLNQKEYEKYVENLPDDKKYNSKVSFVSKMIYDFENKILLTINKYLKDPEIAVLCFDGMMVPKDIEIDIEECEAYVKRKIGITIKLSIKPMDEELIDIPEDIPKYEYFKLETFNDYKNLIGNKEIYKEWVEEWVSNCIRVYRSNGRMMLLTKNTEIQKITNNTFRTVESWDFYKPNHIYELLERSVQVYNYKYDAKYEKICSTLSVRKQVGFKKTFAEEMKPVLYTFLAKLKSKNAILNEMIKNDEIEIVDNIDYIPYLWDEDNVFENHEKFNNVNLFNKFYNSQFRKSRSKFVNSKFFKHLRTQFFDNDDEFKHFLDHIADIIQKPFKLRGSAHLFFSPQGTGKGLLSRFMKMLLDPKNVIIYNDCENYFNNRFNAASAMKLLRIFEEVSEKGAAFKNHNRLKADITSEEDRIEKKGYDAIHLNNYSRFWFFSNNENSLYIENSDRRFTMHRVKGTYANNIEYFKDIVEEIEDESFIKSAFAFFSKRKYEEINVIREFVTEFKKEQKQANLKSGIEFIIEYINERYDIEDFCIGVTQLREACKKWCTDCGKSYNMKALYNHLKEIGIERKERTKEVNYRRFEFSRSQVEKNIQKYLKDDSFKLG